MADGVDSVMSGHFDQLGFSKDHWPDLNQMILAVLLDGDGRPVCTEMWPGNTADAGCLIPGVDRHRLVG